MRYFKITIVLIIVFTISTLNINAFSQTLKRKAWLGTQLSPLSEEKAKQFKLHTVAGLHVDAVIGGTGKELNLQTGDVILSINFKNVNSIQDVVSIIAESFEGDKVELSLIRNNKKQNLKGKFVGRQKEVSAFSEVIYDEAAYKGGKLRVIINKPNVAGKLPAMLFIPGYTCTSIDNLRDNHPYKRFIDAYAKAGFVTLRIEKSGLGDSYQTPSCESCNLLDEIENFEAGLLKLKSLPYIDTTKIIIVSHSMGGIVAPALSAKHNVAGVVAYGTTAKSWFEYQLELYRTQNLLAGLDPLTYEKSVTDQYELNYRFFIKKESLSELSKDPTHDAILKQQWMYDGKGMIYGRNAEYWRQIQDINHLQNWKDTKAKVLIQFGESDFQAFSRADHEQIVRTVNYYNPGNASLITYPNTDHYYAKSGTMHEAFNKFASQQFAKLFEEFNPDVTNSAVKWSLEVINDK